MYVCMYVLVLLFIHNVVYSAHCLSHMQQARNPNLAMFCSTFTDTAHSCSTTYFDGASVTTVGGPFFSRGRRWCLYHLGRLRPTGMY